jgi:hypothetical protein
LVLTFLVAANSINALFGGLIEFISGGGYTLLTTIFVHESGSSAVKVTDKADPHVIFAVSSDKSNGSEVRSGAVVSLRTLMVLSSSIVDRSAAGQESSTRAAHQSRLLQPISSFRAVEGAFAGSQLLLVVSGVILLPLLGLVLVFSAFKL